MSRQLTPCHVAYQVVSNQLEVMFLIIIQVSATWKEIDTFCHLSSLYTQSRHFAHFPQIFSLASLRSLLLSLSTLETYTIQKPLHSLFKINLLS